MSVITPVTPVPGPNTEVSSGGTPVIAIAPSPNGGIIVNPLSAADQGVNPTEILYVDPTGNNPGSAPGAANGTTFALYPGQPWTPIPGQTTATKVNAATSGHKYSAVQW
jgi:hypothetical protein